MNEAIKTYNDFVLPSSVVSKIDLSRLVTEAERIDNELTEATVHAKVAMVTAKQPILSEQFTEFLTINHLALSNGQDRAALIEQLRLLKDRAPVIHMTFATTADQESLAQLAHWFRTSIHPQAVLAIGLQPALVAGVYLRTANQVHDLSLRSAVKNARRVLVKELGALRGSHQ